ncbi:flagellar hook-length control protein FliK [Paeniroseomonas aquatica]|uniref:flagellar hook-length control protein FliK n=1 Tax=Paeniroseomonas aquatica TaxID=373043 RepID=UPI003624694A
MAASPAVPAKPAGDRPMALAAVAGQAAAQDTGTEAAGLPPAGQAAPPPPEPAPEPMRMAVPAVARPEPPIPATATPPPEPAAVAPPGLSPAPAEPAPPPAPVPARTAPPPPPARQVAQVTIALALGSGQAPRLTVALEPESLGRVEIRIERGADGEASSVRVLAERPETLALLQRDARDLDRALGQAGVSVAEGALQSASPPAIPAVRAPAGRASRRAPAPGDGRGRDRPWPPRRAGPRRPASPCSTLRFEGAHR